MRFSSRVASGQRMHSGQLWDNNFRLSRHLVEMVVGSIRPKEIAALTRQPHVVWDMRAATRCR